MIRILASAFACLVLACAAADEKSLAPDPNATLILQRLAEADGPSCLVVGVVRDRTGVSFGCARGAGPAQLDNDSIFEIGSITKGLTGLLLADMVRRGEVRLDDPARKHSRPGARLPTGAGGREITLRDLVTQTAGLPRLPPGFSPRNLDDPYADFGADALYAALAITRVEREPGVSHAYSNFGFMWLSEILERIGGKPFDELLAQRILRPLGMETASMHVPPAREKHRVAGHDVAYRVVPPWTMPVSLSGVGGLRASVDDMLRLAEALAGRRATPLDGTIELALEPLHRLAQPDAFIAYGWMIDGSARRRLHHHSGGTGGFRATLVFDRKAREAAVTLADSAHSFEDLAFHLVDPERPLRRGPAEAARLDAASRKAYAGRYELAPGFVLEVFERAERLFAQATGQPPFALRVAGEGQFTVVGVDATVVFARASGGSAQSLTLVQDGRRNVARRLPE